MVYQKAILTDKGKEAIREAIQIDTMTVTMTTEVLEMLIDFKAPKPEQEDPKPRRRRCRL